MLVRAALVALALPLLPSAAWKTRAPLPLARSEVAAAALGTQVAVVGGFLADGSSSARVDLYRMKTDTWTRAPDLPAPVNHSTAAVLGGRLVVAGGSGATHSAWVLANGRWRALPRAPAGRVAAGAAVLGGRLYVVGGVGDHGLARTARSSPHRAASTRSAAARGDSTRTWRRSSRGGPVSAGGAASRSCRSRVAARARPCWERESSRSGAKRRRERSAASTSSTRAPGRGRASATSRVRVTASASRRSPRTSTSSAAASSPASPSAMRTTRSASRAAEACDTVSQAPFGRRYAAEPSAPLITTITVAASTIHPSELANPARKKRHLIHASPTISNATTTTAQTSAAW